MPPKNVGQLDRGARFVVGGMFVVLAMMNVIGAWGWIGLILVGTALIRICPFYALTGRNTADKND